MSKIIRSILKKLWPDITSLGQATGHHFNLPEHSVTDMRVMAIMEIYRKEMEKEFIAKFNTFRRGREKTGKANNIKH